MPPAGALVDLAGARDVGPRLRARGVRGRPARGHARYALAEPGLRVHPLRDRGRAVHARRGRPKTHAVHPERDVQRGAQPQAPVPETRGVLDLPLRAECPPWPAGVRTGAQPRRLDLIIFICTIA